MFNYFLASTKTEGRAGAQVATGVAVSLSMLFSDEWAIEILTCDMQKVLSAETTGHGQ